MVFTLLSQSLSNACIFLAFVPTQSLFGFLLEVLCVTIIKEAKKTTIRLLTLVFLKSNVCIERAMSLPFLKPPPFIQTEIFQEMIVVANEKSL